MKKRGVGGGGDEVEVDPGGEERVFKRPGKLIKKRFRGERFMGVTFFFNSSYFVSRKHFKMLFSLLERQLLPVHRVSSTLVSSHPRRHESKKSGEGRKCGKAEEKAGASISYTFACMYSAHQA